MTFIVGGAMAIGGASLVNIAAGATLGSMIGSSLAGGFGAQTKGEAAHKKYLAGEVQKEQMALVGDVKKQAYEEAGSQFRGVQRDISMGTGTGIRDISTSADVARSQSGLATSGTIEQKTATQTGNLMAKYKSDMTKLFETRDLSKSSADLQYRQGEMSAEEAYQSTVTDIESQPTGFLEGMFG